MLGPQRLDTEPLFDRIRWSDPVSGAPLEPLILARTPAGVPICGALRVSGTSQGYPIVDCVARLTPQLARRHGAWLSALDLEPPSTDDPRADFQDEASVESFGFQWTWRGDMRSEADLLWRVARQFRVEPSHFAGRLVLDAGAGAGDQSRWMLRQGADVLSVDLSSAIEVVASKLRLEAGWFGVQGDVTALPFVDDLFDIAYCEGVIQHTRDSAATVAELKRVISPGGLILATHYERPSRLRARVKLAWMSLLRRRLSPLDRYTLLLVTGNLAALAGLPLLGRALRLSGTALHYELMGDFKTTWTNTFDYYGGHEHQRHISGEEFWRYFDEVGGLEEIYRSGGRVVARCVPP